MNWNIILSPCAVLPGEAPELWAEVEGSAITLNGETLELADLEDGDRLPRWSIDHPLVGGDIWRSGETIHMTLLLPIAPTAPEEARFPAPIIITEDGMVPLPPLVTFPTPPAETTP